MQRIVGIGMFMLGASMACQPAAETAAEMDARIEQESAAARQAIEALAARFGEHFSAGQADSVASFYTETAVLMPPNTPAVTGRAAIRDFLHQMYTMGQWTLTVRVGNVVANGPIAIESGTFTMEFAPGPNAPMPAMTDTGKYLVHWHKVGDRWLIAEDMWNSNQMMPGM